MKFLKMILQHYLRNKNKKNIFKNIFKNILRKHKKFQKNEIYKTTNHFITINFTNR